MSKQWKALPWPHAPQWCHSSHHHDAVSVLVFIHKFQSFLDLSTDSIAGCASSPRLNTVTLKTVFQRFAQIQQDEYPTQYVTLPGPESGMKQWSLSSAPRKSFPKVLVLIVHDVFLKNSFLRHSGHPPCWVYHWSYPWMILYDVSMNSSVLLWTSTCDAHSQWSIYELFCVPLVTHDVLYELWILLYYSSTHDIANALSTYLKWSLWGIISSYSCILKYLHVCLTLFFRIVGPSPIQYNPHRACLLFVIDQSSMCNSLNEGTQYPNS